MSNYFLSRNGPLTQEDFVKVEAHYTYPGGSNSTVRKLRETVRNLSAQSHSEHIQAEVKADTSANKEEYHFLLPHCQFSVSINSLGATAHQWNAVREPNTFAQLTKTLQSFCPSQLIPISLELLKSTLLAAVNHTLPNCIFQIEAIGDSLVLQLHDVRTRTSAKFELSPRLNQH